MKHITAFFIVFTSLTLLSCNLHRERNKALYAETSQTTQSEYQNSSNHHILSDSTQRYWSFRTDGWFYYHQDSGLIAQRGELHLSESLKQEQMITQVQTRQSDSSSIQTIRQQKEETIIKRKTGIHFWLTIGLILTLTYALSRLQRWLK